MHIYIYTKSLISQQLAKLYCYKYVISMNNLRKLICH